MTIHQRFFIFICILREIYNEFLAEQAEKESYAQRILELCRTGK